MLIGRGCAARSAGLVPGGGDELTIGDVGHPTLSPRVSLATATRWGERRRYEASPISVLSRSEGRRDEEDACASARNGACWDWTSSDPVFRLCNILPAVLVVPLA